MRLLDLVKSKWARSRALDELLDPSSDGPSIEKWDKAFEIADGDPDLLVTLASYHYHKGHRAQLVRTVYRLQAISPGAVRRVPTPSEYEGWRPRLRRVARLVLTAWRGKHVSAQDMFDHARVMEIIGRPEEAELAYRRALEIDPSLDAYERRLLAMKGGAIADSEDANAALVHFHSRFSAEALADSVNRVGGLNGHLADTRLASFSPLLLPAVIDILFIQAALADRLDRLASVLSRLPATVGMPEGDIKSLAWIRAATGKEPAQEAERLYRLVLELKPEHANATFNLAGLLARTNRKDEAAKLFERVGTLSGSLAPHAALQLAIIAEASGDHAKSLEQYTAAAAGIPAFGHHHVAFARGLRRAGRTQEALGHYAAAMGWERYVSPEYVMDLEPIRGRESDLRWHGNPTLSAIETERA